MRPGSIAASLLLTSVIAISKTASADTMDPALERLVSAVGGGACATNTDPPGAGFYRPGSQPCVFDDAAFKRLISQFGFALAPLGFYPARTTGFGGFQIGIQGAFTSIDSGADYWQNGTRGPVDPNNSRNSVTNKSPDSWLQVYNFNLRKGLPFGFELGTNIGYLAHTSIVSGGADVRWSLLEGFRTGLLGIFPDISVGAAVRTITGTPEFQLTVASGDAMVSKPIPIADSSVFTPHIGYQFIRIFGDSGLVDPTPATDSLGYCNYRGQNVPGGWVDPAKPNARPDGPYTGQPVCGNPNDSSGGSSADLNNTKIFQRTRITRHRIIAGISYRYDMVVVGAEFITDVVDPGSANTGDEEKALRGTPRQSTIAVQVGAAF
jgi:hypothetical protein